MENFPLATFLFCVLSVEFSEAIKIEKRRRKQTSVCICQVLYKFILLSFKRFLTDWHFFFQFDFYYFHLNNTKLRESGKLILEHKVSELQNQSLDTGQPSSKTAWLCQEKLFLNKFPNVWGGQPGGWAKGTGLCHQKNLTILNVNKR